ncbi:hypothetical protein [Paenibacillus sp. DCT19]|uniref:hypothetical protein n=1 Tax=Paenibacillus sp. DCT19 TaxID=2211212 RepID=UPI000FE1A7CD|nr:hypothetical protein [Paenibacillus sp. DCT19]
MSHNRVRSSRKLALSTRSKSKKHLRILLNKNCDLKVNHLPDDCACHQPISKHILHRNKCFQVIDGVKPLIKLRLAGINNNLNFELFRHKGNRVIIEVSSGEKSEKIRGVLLNVGTDYVDIKKANGRVITILQSNIQKIEWLGRRKRAPQVEYIADDCGDEYEYDEYEDGEE